MDEKDQIEFDLELEDASPAPVPQEKPAPSEVVDDYVEDEDDNDPATQEYLEKYGKKANKRIRKLVSLRKEAELARAQALQELEKLRAELAQNRTTNTQLQSISIKEAEGRLKAEEAAAKKAFQDALTEGDAEKAAEAQVRLARTVAEAENLKLYKPVEQEKPAERERPQPTQQVQQAPSARTRKWLEENTWFRENPALQAGATIIHQQVVADGYNPVDDEEAYFEELDRRIGQTLNVPRPGNTRKPASPQAMPSAVSTGGAVKRKITLSRQEMDLAERMLMGQPGVETKEAAYKMYAAEKAKREAIR